MTRSFRRDIGFYRKPKVTPQGYLKADGFATRTGIFRYLISDGSVRSEFRPPDEVFQTDSINSLAEVSVTNDHPPEPVTAENTKKYAVGFTGETVDREDQFLKVRMTITDNETIRQMTEDRKLELSCGYTCDVEPAPGEWQGERYDAVQRNIRYNHLAIVSEGRAGPEARVRLDANEGVMVPEKQKGEKSARQGSDGFPIVSDEGQKNEGREPMSIAKLKIDGIEYEVQEGIAKVVSDKVSELDRTKEDLKKVGGEIETLKGRADALSEDLKKKDQEIEKLKSEKPDQKTLLRIARERLDLEDFSKKILGAEVKLDELSDPEIKKQVVQKIYPEAKLDQRSEEYIGGRFDTIRESHKDLTDPVRKTIADIVKGDQENKNDIDSARKRWMEKSQSAWKTGLESGKA